MRINCPGIKPNTYVEMTTPAPVMTMAVPDAEYMEIVRRLHERNHSEHITLISSNKEHIRFYKKGDKVKAKRMIDGKPTTFLVEPLGKLIPNEREWLKKQIHDKNPEYNNARLEYEVDMIYEMRQSVKKIVDETGCKPEDALRAIELGIASQQASEKMAITEEVISYTTKEIKEEVETDANE
jgi:hypothetical protein